MTDIAAQKTNSADYCWDGWDEILADEAGPEDYPAANDEFMFDGGVELIRPSVPKPVPPKVAVENIPEILKNRRQWVCWKYVWKGERWTKMPHQPSGRLASSSDPGTWVDFDTAVRAYRTGKFDGIGFCFADGDGLAGIDIDHCLDRDTKQITRPEAQAIVDQFQGKGYIEVSPGGDGIRIYALGKHGRSGKANGNLSWIEAYCFPSNRFLTITGRRIEESASDPLEAQEQLDWLYETFFKKAERERPEPAPSVTKAAIPAPKESDAALIQRIRQNEKAKLKFSQLFDFGELVDAQTGEICSDHSRADAALCELLAFWTNRDADQMDRIFRQSALMRDKWDEKRGARTYGEMTIENANEYNLKNGGRTVGGMEARHHSEAAGRPLAEILLGIKTWDAHRSDTLTSEIYVEAFGDRLKFVVASDVWLYWDGACWTASSRGEATELAKRVGTAIHDDYGRRHALELERAEQDSKVAAKAAAPWMALGKRACSEVGIRAMLRLAQSNPGVATSSFAEFNTDPFLLNVGNRILDLKTGVLGPHDPKAMMSQITRVNYNPAAQCPRWMKFLDEIMVGDQDTIKTLQQWMGYNLTGSMSLELVAIYFGGGANGKSVFINTMARVAGDYAVAASRSLLVEAPKSNPNAPRSDILATVGKRMAEINETQDRDVLDENTVKGLASPDKISARDMYEKQTQFLPTAKVSLRTQHLPIVKGTDEGIWRRLLPIEFKASFIGRENVNLSAELWEEAEGILAWAVQGAMDLFAPENLNEVGTPKGIFISDAVLRTRTTYRKDSDVLGQFLERYEITSAAEYDRAGANQRLDMRTESGEILYSFRMWCSDAGLQPWTMQTLGRRLRARGIERMESNGKTYYLIKQVGNGH